MKRYGFLASCIILVCGLIWSEPVFAIRIRLKPDLIPAPCPCFDFTTFCCLNPTTGKLLILVKNQGSLRAKPCKTKVEFSPGGTVLLNTPAIPPGVTVIHEVDIPGVCFDSDCDFTITVDDNNDVNESNETNNSANGTCLG